MSMALFRHDVRPPDKPVVDKHSYRTALVPALRRVDGVRVWVGCDGCRAEVYGLGHRHPVTVRVSMLLATQLAQAGAPCDVRVEPDHSA
jgi:hypothetical protein